MTDVCVVIDPVTSAYSRCENSTTATFIREFCRSPFQWSDEVNAGFSTGPSTWLPLAENYKRRNVRVQEGVEGSHIEVYKKLMGLKKTEAGIDGKLFIQALTDDVLLIKRELTDKKKASLISIFNFGSLYTHLGFINQTENPEKIKIQLKRLNSFHDVG